MTRLKELRLTAGFTQKQVAEILGIDQSMISYHENGSSLLNAEQIKTLARLYNVSTDYLLEMDK